MKNLQLLGIAGMLALLPACKPQAGDQLIRFQGEAQGTYYAITYVDGEGRIFQNEVDSILLAFDQVASLWVTNSLLSRINANEPDMAPDPMIEDMVALSLRVSERTEGAFDITVGPLVNAWGFGFKNQQMPDSSQVDSLLQYVGYRKVWLEEGKVCKAAPEVVIDLNAIAQGYSVDLLGTFLESKGIHDYLIDIGGEVLASGKKPDGSLWKVGIERPSEHADDPRELESIVIVSGKALATSGSYRKFYEKEGLKYSHTIDPKTGYPVSHRLLSASVMAESAAKADAYATALMVMGPAKAQEFISSQKELEAFLIFTDESGVYHTWVSPGLAGLLAKDQ